MSTEKIPPWVLRSALLVSLPIAGAALYLTRTYAVGNLDVLGLDANTVFVRRLSIDVLLAAHVAAFFIIALLPDSAFKFRRWQLRILAVAIWAFDGAAIYQARFGVMDSADQAQVSAATKQADLRKSISGLQDQAAATRSTAARQMANKMISKGAQSQADAARLEAEAAAMTKQLAAMPSGAGTTEVRTWGKLAPYKAATESALISFVSLIMLGMAGLTLRELLQQSAARPAPVGGEPVAPVVPTPDQPGLTMMILRWLGVLTGGAAIASGAKAAEPVPVERTIPAQKPAPAIPAQKAPELLEAIPAPIPEKQADIPEEVCTSIPVRVYRAKKSEPDEVQAGIPVHTPKKRRVPAKPVKLTIPELDKIKSESKYQELRVQVAAKRVRVSILGIKRAANVGQEKAAAYREALFAEFPQLRKSA